MKISFAEEFGFTPAEIDAMEARDVRAFTHYLDGKGELQGRKLRKLG